MNISVFDRLDWRVDRVLLDDLVFRLEHYRSESWDGGDHFRFYKIRELMDQYKVFFSRHTDFEPAHIMELGIYDGGSTVLWNEILQPKKIVALDLLEQSDSPYFERYLETRNLRERIKTFWNTDQADKHALRSIVDRELAGQLDLVIDDASHLYSPSKMSFEALFPYMKPGAIYMVEDWAWDHWPDFVPPPHWSAEDRLTRFVFDIAEVSGSPGELIAGVELFQGFVAITRGSGTIEQPDQFTLDACISRHDDLSDERVLENQLPSKRTLTSGAGSWLRNLVTIRHSGGKS